MSRNQLDLKREDLPRCRKNKKVEKDTSYKRENIKGILMRIFLEYKNLHPLAIEMQMDTVEGIKENDAPVLLTLDIIEINFLFIFKIDSQTPKDVLKKLLYFKDIISEEIFNKIVEILLSDNGKEFNILKELSEEFPSINLFFVILIAVLKKDLLKMLMN